MIADFRKFTQLNMTEFCVVFKRISVLRYSVGAFDAAAPGMSARVGGVLGLSNSEGVAGTRSPIARDGNVICDGRVCGIRAQAVTDAKKFWYTRRLLTTSWSSRCSERSVVRATNCVRQTP